MNLHIYRFGRPLVGQVEQQQQQQQHFRTRFLLKSATRTRRSAMFD